MKTRAKRVVWSVVDALLERPSFRSRFSGWVAQLQYRIGIGAGEDPATSGELVVLRILQHREASGAPLCVFDVGASVGDYAAGILGGAASTPVIHCFEPSPAAFAALESRFSQHPMLKLNQVGLASARGRRTLFADSPASALASLTQRNLAHLSMTLDHRDEVDVTTLDDYCREQHVDMIDLCKLDAEGHELEILRGGAETFGRQGVRVVAFEFGGCNIDTRTYLRDYWHFFREYGAKELYRVMPNQRLFAIRRYDERLEAFSTSNYLAILDRDLNRKVSQDSRF